MPAHTITKGRRHPKRLLVVALVASGAAALAGAGVYAGLQATATGTVNVSSGTLKLTLAASGGSVGLPETISNMVPGDVVNTYVDLTNGGTLDARNLGLWQTGGGTTLLTSSATKGLTVTITSCTVAWTVVGGACSGTPAVLGTSNEPVASIPSGSPEVLNAGTFAASGILHLQVGVTLPDQNETTLNGTLPSPTIQGLSDSFTLNFNELQRTATTTNQ